MIKQTQLNFKLGITKDEITPRAGLSVYAEFLRGFGIKELIDKHMPLPGSNRGYKAWNYIEPQTGHRDGESTQWRFWS